MSESATTNQATQLASVPDANAAAVETHAIGREFRDAIDNAAQLSDIIRSVTELICRETKCLALWVSQRAGESGQLQTHPLTEDSSDAVANVVGDVLPKQIEQTMESGTLNSVPVTRSHHLVCAAVAVSPERSELVLSACFLSDACSVDRAAWIMKIGSQAIEQWIVKNELLRTRNQSKMLSDTLSLSSAMDRSESKREAANFLVNNLRRTLEASQVVYCDLANRQQAKLLAISEVEQFDPHSESSRTILSAASSCIGAEEPVIFSPNNSNADPLQNIALDAYCKANRFTSCVGITTKDNHEQPTGVLLVAGKADSVSEAQLKQLEQFAAIHGTHLEKILARLVPSKF